MQQFFYSSQIRRYIIQFIRMVSNFQVEFGRDREGVTALQRVPVIYGDSSRQTAAILKQNSENYLNSVPAMAVYITGLTYDRQRVQSPTYVGKLTLRERYYNPETGQYSTTEGDLFNVERLMPVPYKLTLKLDVWTSNTEQKLQLLEQLCTLFNPALEIQNTDNYIDWSSLTYVLLTDVQWSSRTVPIGTETPIDIASLTFEIPIYINSPALIKKLGVIQKIITSIYDANGNIDDAVYDDTNLISRQVFTPLQYGTILLGNQITLVRYNDSVTDTIGENIIQTVTSNATANTRIVVSDTSRITANMRISHVRVTGQGFITGTTSSNVITGVSTSFIDTLEPGYSLYSAAVNSNGVFIGNVGTINSNTSLQLTANAQTTITSGYYSYKENISQKIVKVLSVNGDVVLTNKSWNLTKGDVLNFNQVVTDKSGRAEPWRNLINVYGNIRPGLSQIKFEMPNGNEIVGTIAYNPQDDSALIWNVDIDTIPSNTLAPVNAIINPLKERPDRHLQSLAPGTRYLLVADYASPSIEQPIYNWVGADNTPLVARANDIIQYNGNHWIVDFNSALVSNENYVTNLTSGIQYRWTGSNWQKSYEGYYEAGKWDIVL